MSRKAIIQVENFDKVSEFARYLVSSGWEILSAGKTASFFRKERIPFTEEQSLSDAKIDLRASSNLMRSIISADISKPNSDFRNVSLNHSDEYPASLEALVGNTQDTESLTGDVFIVCMNLYLPSEPVTNTSLFYSTEFFYSTVIRNACSNYENVMVITDPEDYKESMVLLRTDNVSNEFRFYLAGKALNFLSAYEGTLSSFIMDTSPYAPEFIPYLSFPLKKYMELHGGSNPQQVSCLYNFTSDRGALSGFKKLQGKELTYNIISDLSVVWDLISTLFINLKNQFTVKSINSEGYEFTSQFTPLSGTVFTVAVKNRAIIGAALSTNVLDSFKKTYTYDYEIINEVVLGCSAVIDEEAAMEIAKEDFAAIIAPGFTDEAREIFLQNKNIRLIPTARVSILPYEIQLINGGLLFQSRDKVLFDHWNVKTKMRPSQKQTDEMSLGMLIALQSRSYTAVLLRSNAIVGISQGCTSVNKAVRNVLNEAKDYEQRNRDSNQFGADTLADILVSDYAIPFTDEVRELIEKGVTSIIQTGGTSTDDEFIKFCDERGVVMVFTDMTHISF